MNPVSWPPVRPPSNEATMTSMERANSRDHYWLSLLVRENRRSLTLAICLLLGASVSSTISGQPPAATGQPRIIKRPFRENVSLPADNNLPKLFGTIEDLLSESRWTEAIRILQELAQAENKSLVLVQPGQQGGIATYLNVATRCNVLLSRIPDVGRTAYRQKTDAQARRWFESWQRSRDEAELLKIVRQAFLSSYGDDALLALGEVAWDRGDFSAARMWWEQLIPLPDRADASRLPTVLRYPDSEADQPTVLARIVMCAILAKESNRAADELEQFATRYPLAEGRIAGQDGRFAEILRQTFESSKGWTPNQSAAEVRTFGESAARCREIGDSIDVGAIRWVHPLPISFLPQVNDKLPFPAEPLSYHPVVFDQRHDKIVLLNDANTIRAWNLLTGEPAWQSEGRDPAAIYSSSLDDRAVVTERNCVGTPHYTMTIDEGRLYARMGSPVTCPSTSELRPARASELVCLDLNQEGKLLWKLTADDLFVDDDSWQYEGSPIIVSGRAYFVVCRRHPQLELMVVCVDADDGRLLWKRPVGSFRTSVEDSQNRISHLLLTSGGGRLFLSTDAGAIVALDAQDGRLEWALSYESRTDELLTLPRDFRRKASLIPAIYHAGLLFVAPNDSTSGFCIEADSGHIQWQFPYAQETAAGIPETLQRSRQESQLQSREWWHLLGIVRGGTQGRLIAGGNSLMAIDIETGQIAWSARSGGHGLKPGFGRGLVSDHQILVPLRESIDVFDPKTGVQLQSIPMKTPDSDQRGGNLALSGGVLLVAQPNRLAAYGEFSAIKQRIDAELTARPNDPALSVQRAELAGIDGQFDEAKADFRRLLGTIDPTSESDELVRRKFSKTLLKSGDANLLAAKLPEARDDWNEALAVTDLPQSKMELLFKVAEVEASLGQTEQALAHLQQIILDETMGSRWRVNQTARYDAVTGIENMLQKLGTQPYHAIESMANQELQELQGPSDTAGLKRLIARYPHAEAAAKARQQLVESYHKSGDIFEACAVLEALRRDAASDDVVIDATLSMIELLTPTKATHVRNSLWQSLASRPSSKRVTYSGTTHDLPELVKSHLTASNDSEFIAPAPIERVWSESLAPDSLIVVPERQPITDELAAVLICTPHPKTPNTWSWRCHDWKTGRIRWEETAPDPIHKAVWSPFHLLIATQHGWQARTADRGDRVWEFVVPSSIEPIVVEQSEITVWPGTFSPELGLELFAPETGQLTARLKPPGHLHHVVGIVNLSQVADQHSQGPRSTAHQVLSRGESTTLIAMQTIEPTRAWAAIAQSPMKTWSVNTLSQGGDIWSRSPICLQNTLVASMSEHRIAGYQIDPLSLRSDATRQGNNSHRPSTSASWISRDFAYAFGEPYAFADEDRLFVIADNSQLISLDPADGTRRWMTSLAEFPLQDPPRQVALNEGQIFVASQGLLRSISLRTGTITFETYLGSSSAQWKTVLVQATRKAPAQAEVSEGNLRTSSGRSVVATWPARESAHERHFAWLCDANTGIPLQKIRTDSEPTHFIVNQNGLGILATRRSLIGLRSGISKTTDDVR
ncbi:outer membrane protein assembly factor BamB family protein [Schlesneria paludicola]|uniref:outer membrane protein assembly factor BamB family protein n=1 Tax=Schlesneria paludicola TaxID=360056 RepID=UPI00058D03C5|nr:PQQ-binding-like beta-propeller repeat protein [Schlesneria paludicola]